MTIQKRKLAEYSYNNDLNFYFNAKSIPNIDLVFATFDYFESGERQGVFTPLNFLNLLLKQYDFLRQNLETPIDYLQHLKNIPLTEIQQHILYGFLLKWFGGYPIEESFSESNKPQEVILRFIERDFLKYTGETPEKKFCQKNWIDYQRKVVVNKMITELINQRPSEIEKEKLEMIDHIMKSDNLPIAGKEREKLKWKAGPSYLGHLIDELDRNGYIDLPDGSNEKKAEFLLTIFDLKTTPGTLAKQLSENSNDLTPDSKGRITIKTLPKEKKS